MCALCHISGPGTDGMPPLFTDFTYDNLGIPPNPDNPWYFMDKAFNPDGAAWEDEGLGGFLKTVPRFADRAAEIAKEAYRSGRTIRELCLEKRILGEDELDRILDARRMTGK